MNSLLQQNSFLYVPNFISHDKAVYLAKEFFRLEESGQYNKDRQAPKSPSIYNFKPFLELLCEKTLEVSALIEEAVLPTYTYSRIYKHGETLARHTDRPACEISLTLNLEQDMPWDFGIKKPNGEEVNINLNPGDALLYLGCVAEHWRDKPFSGQNYPQVFLHYVRSNGPCVESYFDRRQW
jgi:alkylated DNA repair dioxygenase AlkB